MATWYAYACMQVRLQYMYLGGSTCGLCGVTSGVGNQIIARCCMVCTSKASCGGSLSATVHDAAGIFGAMNSTCRRRHLQSNFLFSLIYIRTIRYRDRQGQVSRPIRCRQDKIRKNTPRAKQCRFQTSHKTPWDPVIKLSTR